MRNLGAAALAAFVIVATEYAFRHYVLFWMPILGTLRVNDMAALAMTYSLLLVAFGSMAHARWREELTLLGNAFRDFATQWTFTPWLLGMMFALVVLSPLDQWLWAGLRFPMWVSGFRNQQVWFASIAPVLEVVALIAVNGLFVPVAEEYLWRGFIQPRLSLVLPASVAIATTAILFSLKHVMVDASWGRFLTLVAFGAICGVVAHRHSWRSSAALHMIVNTATTAVGFFTAGR